MRLELSYGRGTTFQEVGFFNLARRYLRFRSSDHKSVAVFRGPPRIVPHNVDVIECPPHSMDEGVKEPPSVHVAMFTAYTPPSLSRSLTCSLNSRVVRWYGTDTSLKASPSPSRICPRPTAGDPSPGAEAQIIGGNFVTSGSISTTYRLLRGNITSRNRGIVYPPPPMNRTYMSRSV